jgi:hypothetical protein
MLVVLFDEGTSISENNAAYILIQEHVRNSKGLMELRNLYLKYFHIRFAVNIQRY